MFFFSFSFSRLATMPRCLGETAGGVRMNDPTNFFCSKKGAIGKK